MRLIFFGTGTFAVPALKALAERVVLVVTQPDRPAGRGMKLHPTPVKLAALELGLPVETPEKSRAPEFVDRLRNLNADALVVASYGQILSQAVLDSATRGGINLHGSILPKYRGAAPIQRAILAGETETGVTLMQMDRGMDTGDAIDVVRTEIGPDETYGDLQDRLAEVAAQLVAKWLPRIVVGDYPRTPQDPVEASVAPKVEKEDAELDCRNEAPAEYRRFRAFTPSPGAFLRTNRGLLKLSNVRISHQSGNAGAVLDTRDGVLVAFGSGSLKLLEVQPEGKRRMSGSDFANGARLKPGDRLI
ncbi:MAG TPA: methionyl-tRNA formyltransferase [Fimbriimonas sp.]|nr:methionyl-tRNA formyltransferase [Fimbriimonas sp.]